MSAELGVLARRRKYIGGCTYLGAHRAVEFKSESWLSAHSVTNRKSQGNSVGKKTNLFDTQIVKFREKKVHLTKQSCLTISHVVFLSSVPSSLITKPAELAVFLKATISPYSPSFITFIKITGLTINHSNKALCVNLYSWTYIKLLFKLFVTQTVTSPN